MKLISNLMATLLVGALALAPIYEAKANTNTDAPMDCTFTIKGNFDGTMVNVTITVSSVSLAECVLLKAGVKAAIKSPSK